MSAVLAVDVVVAGAGPAGTAAALSLVRSGASVALVDPFDEHGPRGGETLSPSTRDPLTQLALWDRFLAAGHQPAHAIRSAWGHPDAVEQEVVLHPYGSGWQVDRRAFDRMLVEAAVRAGARPVTGSIDRSARSRGFWSLRAGARELRAHHVVDATGRGARFARRLGARRAAVDRLVGVVAGAAAHDAAAEHDAATLLEAVEGGWWHSTRTAGDRLLLAYMTDADLWARVSREPHALARLLEAAPLTRRRLRGAPAARARVVAAVSAHLHPAAGPGWIAAGDAAMAVDPLSGGGVCLALRSGMRAAGTVLRELSGHGDAAREYSADVERAFTAYMDQWRWFYAQERRFAACEFWRRRTAASPRPSGH
jgi:flavin-dependent dehydrogenase